jgi:hypothetical protein
MQQLCHVYMAKISMLEHVTLKVHLAVLNTAAAVAAAVGTGDAAQTLWKEFSASFRRRNNKIG